MRCVLRVQPLDYTIPRHTANPATHKSNSFVLYFVGINIFVAFFVLLLLLADSTPPAATNIPLIGTVLLQYMYNYTLRLTAAFVRSLGA